MLCSFALDLPRQVGGSVYLLRGDGGLENSESRFLVGFTSVDTNREYNPLGQASARAAFSSSFSSRAV